MCFGGSQLETRSTGSASGTQTSGSSPRPIPRPDTSSPVYRVSQAVSTAASNLARDVSMGVAVFGKDREAGAEKLASQGYSKEKIDDYYARTDANIAAQAQQRQWLSRPRHRQGLSLLFHPNQLTQQQKVRPLQLLLTLVLAQQRLLLVLRRRKSLKALQAVLLKRRLPIR
jgi:hypothetical protein